MLGCVALFGGTTSGYSSWFFGPLYKGSGLAVSGCRILTLGLTVADINPAVP